MTRWARSRCPLEAYYGASTQRAVDNFPISGQRFSRSFIRALGLLKGSAASVSSELGFIDSEISAAIRQAGDEVMEGDLDEHFVLDIFQTGSGTSTNTNANEVIAARACELLGDRAGGKVHPNDHVNFGQSSNDVIPAAIHIAAVDGISGRLIPSLQALAEALGAKASEFADIVKSGRTHLMDATPVTLGQEFGGWSAQVGKGAERLVDRAPRARRARPGRHRGRHRDQRPGGICPRRDRADVGTHRSSVPRGRPTTSRRKEPKTPR